MTINELKLKLKESVDSSDVINTKKLFEDAMSIITESIHTEYQNHLTENFLVEGEEFDDEEEDIEEETNVPKTQEDELADDDEEIREEEEEEEEDDEDKVEETIPATVAGVVASKAIDKVTESEFVADVNTKDKDKTEDEDDTAKTKKKSRVNGKSNRSGK